jgi:hypothetical protein
MSIVLLLANCSEHEAEGDIRGRTCGSKKENAPVLLINGVAPGHIITPEFHELSDISVRRFFA